MAIPIEDIVIGETYFTPSVVYFPVEVKVISVKKELSLVEIEQGFIVPERLYRNEQECPKI